MNSSCTADPAPFATIASARKFYGLWGVGRPVDSNSRAGRCRKRRPYGSGLCHKARCVAAIVCGPMAPSTATSCPISFSSRCRIRTAFGARVHIHVEHCRPKRLRQIRQCAVAESSVRGRYSPRLCGSGRGHSSTSMRSPGRNRRRVVDGGRRNLVAPPGGVFFFYSGH